MRQILRFLLCGAAFALSGAAFSVPLRNMPYGREFYIRDPDGYILGFIQPTDTR